MKTKKLTVTAIVLFVIAGGFFCLSSKYVKPEAKTLKVQSNVEMTETNINSMIGGKVKSVSVKEGDSVKKGQVLIVIDSDTLNAQLMQARARITATEAQREAALAANELANASYARIKTMFDQGVITKAEFDEASAKRRQAASGLDALNSQLQVAKGSLTEIMSYLDKATITAPASGIVTQVNVDPGELVSSGMPLVVITDTSSSWIQCSVRETNLSKVSLGQSVTVSLPAYKNEVFKGSVVRINKDADFAVKRATNANGEYDILSYGVKVELTGNDKPLYSGMTAIVDFGK